MLVLLPSDKPTIARVVAVARSRDFMILFASLERMALLVLESRVGSILFGGRFLFQRIVASRSGFLTNQFAYADEVSPNYIPVFLMVMLQPFSNEKAGSYQSFQKRSRERKNRVNGMSHQDIPLAADVERSVGSECSWNIMNFTRLTCVCIFNNLNPKKPPNLGHDSLSHGLCEAIHIYS